MAVSVITGAGSGIGRATAVLLASRGHRLALVGRTREALEETAAVALDCLVLPTDIGNASQARDAIDRAVAEFGRVDNLINNAGYAVRLPIEKHQAVVLEREFITNALGPANMIAQVWPTLVRQRSGCIVNVSTMGTIDPFPGFFGYAASKAAVNLMAVSCAKEGREFNIRAFAVAPGAVETGMLRSVVTEAEVPRGGAMAPERVARVIVDCIEGRLDDRNGQVIEVQR